MAPMDDFIFYIHLHIYFCSFNARIQLGTGSVYLNILQTAVLCLSLSTYLQVIFFPCCHSFNEWCRHHLFSCLSQKRVRHKFLGHQILLFQCPQPLPYSRPQLFFVSLMVDSLILPIDSLGCKKLSCLFVCFSDLIIYVLFLKSIN